MTKTKFKYYIEKSPHKLAEIIKSGEIDFTILVSYISEINVPPLIKIAMLIHPKCTLKIFDLYYWFVIQKIGDSAVYDILQNAPILNDLKAIAIVMNSEESSIVALSKNIHIWTKHMMYLMKNQYVSDEIKMMFYETTGNIEYLPVNAKDIFIF